MIRKLWGLLVLIQNRMNQMLLLQQVFGRIPIVRIHLYYLIPDRMMLFLVLHRRMRLARWELRMMMIDLVLRLRKMNQVEVRLYRSLAGTGRREVSRRF